MRAPAPRSNEALSFAWPRLAHARRGLCLLTKKTKHRVQMCRSYCMKSMTFAVTIVGFAATGNPSLETRTAYRGRDRGRPAAWCGWEMRHLVGADPGPSFNLARNWAHWGRPGAAGIGAVVVWPHHVGKIVGRENGQWIVQSGNDGHAVRTRPRSIAGAIAIRRG